jgi:hypothetical protein
LIDTLREHMPKGEGFGIFVQQTQQRDYQERLAKIIERYVPEAKVAILRADTCKSNTEREDWLDERVKEGYNVLICYPQLVETGLDLLRFNNLAFFEPEMKLKTMLQASKRAYRINQNPNIPCRVYFPFYHQTSQAAAMALISKKLYADARLNGQTMSLSMSADDDGSGDMMTALRERIESGDKGGYVDLSERFAQINAIHASTHASIYDLMEDEDHPSTEPVAAAEETPMPEAPRAMSLSLVLDVGTGETATYGQTVVKGRDGSVITQLSMF